MLQLFYQSELVEAGCDEAGRGCLAGPVFAASVVLPPNFHHPLLNDSKQVTETNRNALKSYIEEKAVAFAVAMVDNDEIDKINILKASFKAMHLAISSLAVKPGLLLIDGNQFIKYKRVPHKCIIKGDEKYASIAAASILAKTYRDAYMMQLHAALPQYAWNNNKGYGTVEHRRAIERYGLSTFHRKTFRVASVQSDLF